MYLKNLTNDEIKETLIENNESRIYKVGEDIFNQSYKLFMNSLENKKYINNISEKIENELENHFNKYNNTLIDIFNNTKINSTLYNLIIELIEVGNSIYSETTSYYTITYEQFKDMYSDFISSYLNNFSKLGLQIYVEKSGDINNVDILKRNSNTLYIVFKDFLQKTDNFDEYVYVNNEFIKIDSIDYSNKNYELNNKNIEDSIINLNSNISKLQYRQDNFNYILTDIITDKNNINIKYLNYISNNLNNLSISINKDKFIKNNNNYTYLNILTKDIYLHNFENIDSKFSRHNKIQNIDNIYYNNKLSVLISPDFEINTDNLKINNFFQFYNYLTNFYIEDLITSSKSYLNFNSFKYKTEVYMTNQLYFDKYGVFLNRYYGKYSEEDKQINYNKLDFNYELDNIYNYNETDKELIIENDVRDNGLIRLNMNSTEGLNVSFYRPDILSINNRLYSIKTIDKITQYTFQKHNNILNENILNSYINSNINFTPDINILSELNNIGFENIKCYTESKDIIISNKYNDYLLSFKDIRTLDKPYNVTTSEDNNPFYIKYNIDLSESVNLTFNIPKFKNFYNYDPNTLVKSIIYSDKVNNTNLDNSVLLTDVDLSDFKFITTDGIILDDIEKVIIYNDNNIIKTVDKTLMNNVTFEINLDDLENTCYKFCTTVKNNTKDSFKIKYNYIELNIPISNDGYVEFILDLSVINSIAISELYANGVYALSDMDFLNINKEIIPDMFELLILDNYLKLFFEDNVDIEDICIYKHKGIYLNNLYELFIDKGYKLIDSHINVDFTKDNFGNLLPIYKLQKEFDNQLISIKDNSKIYFENNDTKYFEYDINSNNISSKNKGCENIIYDKENDKISIFITNDNIKNTNKLFEFEYPKEYKYENILEFDYEEFNNYREYTLYADIENNVKLYQNDIKLNSYKSKLIYLGYYSNEDNLLILNFKNIEDNILLEYPINKEKIIGNNNLINDANVVKESIIGTKILTNSIETDIKLSEYFCGKYFNNDDTCNLIIHNDLAISCIINVSYKINNNNETITEIITLESNQLKILTNIYGFVWFVYKIGELDNNIKMIESETWLIN